MEQTEVINPLERLIRFKTLSIGLGFVVFFILSIICWVKIPLEVMPKETTEPFLYLQIQAGQSLKAEEMELALSIPVEGAIRTVSGIRRVETSSTTRGGSFSISFKPKTDMDFAQFSLQEALQELADANLFSMKQVKISRFNPEADAIIKLTVTVPVQIKNSFKLIKKELKGYLETTSGIAKVEIQGIEPVEYQLNITAEKVFEHDLNAKELGNSLSFEKVLQPIGEAPLFSERKLTSMRATLITKDLNAVRSKSLKKGTGLTLSKVANEKKVDKSYSNISRKNGEHTVFIEIYQSPNTTVFELEKNVSERLEKINEQSENFKLLKIDTLVNKAKDLKFAINDVFGSLYLAIVITFVIVFIFLRKLIPTIIISSVIPLSILFCVALIFMKGGTLNLLTLSGLILSIGLIVDNAIVVVERIQQLKSSGLKGKIAASKGASDVAIPLLMSTMTTIIIFLPAAFIESGDTFTNMLKSFQVPVICALLSSYFIALLLVPILGLVEKKVDIVKEEEANPLVVKIFHKIQNSKYLVVMILFLLFYSLFNYVKQIEETDIDQPRDPYTNVNFKFNKEIDTMTRRRIFGDWENKFISYQKILNFKSLISDFTPERRNGSMNIYPHKKGNMDEVLEALDKKIMNFIKKQEKIPGLDVSMDSSSFSFGGVSKKKTFRFQGPKSLSLNDAAVKLKAKLQNVPGISHVNTKNEERGSIGYVFTPYQDILSQYGLSLKSLADQITSLMRDYSVEGIRVDGQDVETSVKITPKSGIWNAESFLDIKISAGPGKLITLSNLGTLKISRNTRSISRKNGVSKTALYAHYDMDKKSRVRRKAKNRIRDIVDGHQWPKGMGPEEEESMAQIIEMQKRSRFVVALSIFLIYLLMASLFESPLLPFAILFTVPLAIIFGVFGLKIFEYQLDPMARLGLIILVGIVVNNAIILIDVILSLKEQGRKRVDAIALGCAQRLKAVFMTTATTIFGLLPVAFGQSKIMGIPYSTLGIVIISGMLFSTLITLVLLPVVYVFFDNLELFLKKFFKLKTS